MTTFYPDVRSVTASMGVYAPQQDSHLLIEAMQSTGVVAGQSMADICTGSGVVAVAAAQLGAESVTAFDICGQAVDCARRNSAAAGVRVDARRGTLSDAERFGPYDVVVSNPPYVPAEPGARPRGAADVAGPARAWDAGPDGRLVLDPLCRTAPRLLRRGATMLIVQSEFADPQRSVQLLRRGGLDADVMISRTIPFGPVLTARAGWMETVGLLSPGRRAEEIVVIRAEKS